MDALAILKDKIMAVLETLERQGVISAGLDTTSIAIETPKDDTFGDLSSNVAMVLSKQAKRNPRELAKYFVDQLAKDSSIQTVELAGPGFLNFKLKNNDIGDYESYCVNLTIMDDKEFNKYREPFLNECSDNNLLKNYQIKHSFASEWVVN